jgi:MFS family permease
MLLNEYKKPTREHYKIFGLSWAGWIFDFYDLMLFSFLLIPISKELGFSNLMISYAIGIALLATAIGGIFFGALADKYGRKKVLELTIIVYSIGAFLSGFTFSIWSLLLFRIITGFGVGGEWATGQTYISETFPPNLRGRFGGIMQTGAPLGIMLASVVGGLLSPIIGWRYCFMLSVIPALIVVYMRRNLQESDMWIENKGETDKKDRFVNEFKLLVSKEYRKIFLLSLVLCIFGMSAYWFTYTWLPDYLYAERGLSLVKSALWVIIVQVGGFLGYASFGYVSDKIGRRPTFTIYGVIMAIGISMITIFWGVVESNPQMILFFMFLVGFGTGFFGGFGPLFSEVFPTRIRNTGMGTVFNLSRGVQFLTPVVIALISASSQMSYGIFLAAIFAILCGLWIWTFPETKGIKLSKLEEENKIKI